MFTGIIEATARILEATPSKLTIERPQGFGDVRVGSSISVSGVCLTVVKLTKSAMAFDVVPETLKRTTLGNLKVGDRMNLERALKVGDRFEGHMVLGHVDGMGYVERIVHPTSLAEGELRVAGGHVLTISYPKALRGLIVEKGSIAVDGVSLTVAKVTKDRFSVALIPHTLRETTLGELEKGNRARRGAVAAQRPSRLRSRRGRAPTDGHAETESRAGRSRVNIEVDVVGRYVRAKIL